MSVLLPVEQLNTVSHTVRRTVPGLLKRKGSSPVIALTAYDYTTARWVDAGGADMILVGDSLGNVIQGHESTLPVTMDQMVYHTACVARGARNALVIADMPFGSFQVRVEETITHAIRLVQEGGAQAVKLEGATTRVLPAVTQLVQEGVPVVGHVGLTPQSVHTMGGFRRQGKTEDQAERILHEAIQLAEAGVFAIVLECIPADLSERITAAVGSVLTIGIGSGPACDGQILVSYDLLGMLEQSPPFAPRYAEFSSDAGRAISRYIRDVHKEYEAATA